MLRIIITYCLFIISLCAYAAKPIPPLEREISVKVSNEPVSNVLSLISQQTQIKFSYNPTAIPVSKKVAINLFKKPVRTVLNYLFGESVRSKQHGDYIILTPNNFRREITMLQLSGYVYDQNGAPLPDVSLLNANLPVSAVSNQYGYYRLQVPVTALPLKLKAGKWNYQDTGVIFYKNQTTQDITLCSNQKPDNTVVALLPDTSQMLVVEPAIPELPKTRSLKTFFGEFVLSAKTKINMLNLKDTLFSKYQVSLIPFISTNKLLVGNTVNDVSVNILAGYSQGVRKAEFAGLMNIDRGDVSRFQAAGICNAVGGNVSGVQLAGWANLDLAEASGLRIAGFVNVGKSMRGVIIGGMANINADYVSGYKRLRNITNDTVIGVQVAGLFNVNAGYSKGVKLAGLYNFGNNMHGFEGAGLFNGNAGFMHGQTFAGLVNLTAGKSSGLQTAGLANISLSEMKGVQVAGILNVAKNISGNQFAFINLSDTCKGIPFGFFSFSSHGYHKGEFCADEILPAQVAFRTGVRKFHNIFIAGLNPFRPQQPLLSIGYGLGSNFALTQKWSIQSDLTSQLLLERDHFKNAPRVISLFAGIEKSFGKNSSLCIGPVYRMLINSAVNNAYSEFNNSIAPHSFYDKTYTSGTQLKMWAGAKISFKFQ